MTDQEKIDLLKQLRTNTKISISKKISKIDKFMDENKAISEIVTISNSMQEKIKQATDLTAKLVSADKDEEESYREWLNDLETNASGVEAKIKKYSIGNPSDTQIKDHTTRSSELKDNQEATKLNDDLSCDAKLVHDPLKMNELIKNKIYIIDQRIQMIRKLITEKGSPSRIQLLHEKVQVIMEDTKCMSQTYISLDEIEMEVDSCGGEVAEYLESKRDNKTQPQQNICNQIKRVELPKFKGEKREYFSWKAAFDACIDSSPVSEEIKLLHLKQYLEGDALKSISGLGHTALSYNLALQILEEKFGGERRQTTMYLEQVESFPRMRNDKKEELDKLCHLVNMLTLSLNESKRLDELGAGLLYIQLQKKLTGRLLTQYHRWIHEKKKEESVLVLKEYLFLELKFLTIASETIGGINGDTNLQTFQTQLICAICSKSHEIEHCSEFLNMTESERWNLARKKGLCYCCLKPSHLSSSCKNKQKCTINNCNQFHHELLHKGFKSKGSHRSEENSDPIVSLRTLPIIIYNDGKELLLNALLDDGSSQTFINADVVKELGIDEANKRDVMISVLNNNNESVHTSDVSFEISGVDKNKRFKITALTAKQVVGDMKATDWNTQKMKFSHLKTISFPKVSAKNKVDILIGIDYPQLHSSIQEKGGKSDEPIARLTPLGWTCIGKTNDKEKSRITSHFVGKLSMFSSEQSHLNEINDTMAKFWSIEKIPKCESPLTIKDKSIVDNAHNSFRRTPNGERYEIGIPWKETKNCLQNNYDYALKRLWSTEQQLKKKPHVKKMYGETLSQYIQKGYIREVGNENSEETRWFLPHFPIIRLQKETTKVRIVFDASAQYEGLSLNETIESGPNLQQDLLKVLLRFRKNKIAIACDIQEMYLQVQLPETDRPFFRFLWRTDEKQIKPTIFEFQRVIFGGTASPFQAQFVAKENAKSHADEFPRAAETVIQSTYMDDSLDSETSIKKTEILCKELDELWKKAGMVAKKWMSNDPRALSSIPMENRAKRITINGIDKLPVTKTLGLIWDAENDRFQFNVSAPASIPNTKREFLKISAAIFDPLGFLSPFVIRAKVLMQTLWLKKYDWDDKFDADICKAIARWIEELNDIKILSFPRCLTSQTGEVLDKQIHIFVDASEDAYACVAYMRTELSTEEIKSVLIGCKTKVAPLEAISVPRLELLAAEIGSELGNRLMDALGIEKEQLFYWTDSKDVLGWLSNRSRMFKPFVAHKIATLHKNTNTANWKKIASKINIADIATRGKTVKELEKIPQWLNGPDFLTLNRQKWPEEEIKEVKLKEMKSCFLVHHLEDDYLDPTEFSSWNRLCQVTAWSLRFLNNCKDKLKRAGPLEFDEIQDARDIFIRKVQKIAFKHEMSCLQNQQQVQKSSQLLVLCPVLDENGILRANSRISNAEFLNYNTKFPIILPRGQYITQLIVKQYHEDGNHCRGINGTLADISSKYWLISGREEIKEWEKKCNHCKRRKAKPSVQIMAPLHPARLGSSMKAFDNCGLDYAGPFLTKMGRGKTRSKRYLCLFTCQAVRAVHLEMAYSLNTQSFINAFFRFTSRRGFPSHIASDNGTNFVAGEKELRACLKDIDKNEIIRRTSLKGIKWTFNPPRSPHHGGVFEIMIKCAKKAIYSQLKDADFTDEELLTFLTSAEGIINSRPMTYQSSSPEDLMPLTPNHFLHGQMGGELAPQLENGNILARWRRIQEALNHFWRRWLKEWLPIIGKRNKWNTKERNIRIGDVVLVIFPASERGKWPLGRISKAIPGRDGNVRIVEVMVNGKTYRRGLNTICHLDVMQ